MRRLSPWLAFIVALQVTSCMGREGSEPEPARSGRPEAAPAAEAPALDRGSSVSEAQIRALEEELARSEERLYQELGRVARLDSESTSGMSEASGEAAPTPNRAAKRAASRPRRSTAAGGPPAPAARPPSPQSPMEDLDVGRGAEAEQRAEASKAEPCALACRSYLSMSRSATQLCSLTGEQHPRCHDARERVSKAEARLAASGCDCQG